jgi:uncharacterized YigZ family protein
MSGHYLIPASSISHCTVEKKSRFITFVSEVNSKSEAIEHLRTIAVREVGANHNCYAYIIGNPSSPLDIHCSDDGEPSGTAGRPLLNILQHENLGNVLVVVTRYFGGIKLGSGGLVRAYSNALKMALAEIEIIQHVEKKKLRICFQYQFEGVIRYTCKEYGVVIHETNYEQGPCFIVELEEAKIDLFV